MTQQKTDIQLTNWEIVSVNPSDKQWSWKTLFCFWGISVQSIIGFSLIASLYLLYDLNFLVVLTGSLIGSIFVYFLCNLIGKPSQRHGIPFPVLLRTSLGIRGAKYISLLRGLVGIFMFGVQTFFISKSLGYLIRIAIHSYDQSMMDKEIFLTFFFAMNIIDWVAFFLALTIQVLLFSMNGVYTMFKDKKQELMLFATGHIYRETGTASKHVEDKEFSKNIKLEKKKSLKQANVVV